MMKRLVLAILICFIGLSCAAQFNQVSIINFQVKRKLPANIMDWQKVPGALMLIAQKMPQVQQLREPKLVLQLKLNGSVVAGNNFASAQPMASFGLRNFSTNELVSILDNDKPLKEGSYQLCAQFFNLDKLAISEEVCKEILVENIKLSDYTVPVCIAPDNNKVLSEKEQKKPIIFRWLPVLPKPDEPVVYRLRVWQLMQGQNAQAIARTSTPIYEKDVNNITQFPVANLLSSLSCDGGECRFVWTVQAFTKDEKPIGKNNGVTEYFGFSFKQNLVTTP
jgi:hypothetical protein